MTMPRQFEGDTLVIATHNPGKVPEIMVLLPEWIVNVTNSAAQGLPEPIENGTSFVENATIKATDAAKRSGLISLADDSGLCVEALGGQPGYQTADWAGPGKDFKVAMRRILDLLGDNPNRKAHFTCVLALAWADGHVEYVEGRCEGMIATEMRGDKGFGCDPLFIADGHDKTFGEDPSPKDEISHRADAFRQLRAKCFGGTPLKSGPLSCSL